VAFSLFGYSRYDALAALDDDANGERRSPSISRAAE